jgi:DNA repair protein RadD
MITLRPYQAQAVEKLLWAHTLQGADICCLPTGAGKSIVIAELAHRLNQPILILQPSKEILEQNYNKLANYVEHAQIGIYSASMNRKDLGFYTLATIQSIYKIPEKFRHFRTVIVDECHNIDPKSLSGMYTSFFQAIEEPKIIGFTATPYRMALMYRHDSEGLQAVTTTKLINRMKNRFWHRIVFNIDNADLVAQDYLVPLRYLDKSVIRHTEIPLNISRSEFDLKEFERRIVDKEEEIIDALCFAEQIGKSVLVFCSSVEQANHLSEVMEGVVVTAETGKKERDRIIQSFKNGKIKMVFNVGVLTTGFDHPQLDCIVLLRPTRSLALYYQMLGRGVRKAEGKKFCRIVDLTGTVEGMGRIETIRVLRKATEEGKMEWQIESEANPRWHNYALDSFLIAPAENSMLVKMKEKIAIYE